MANLVASETFVDVASIFEAGMVESRLVDGGNVAKANAPKIVDQIENATRRPRTSRGERGQPTSCPTAFAATRTPSSEKAPFRSGLTKEPSATRARYIKMTYGRPNFSPKGASPGGFAEPTTNT
ncbi:hypothetical protein, partial [Nostocoides sp.]|uniref:hypothetical protein n=1 Tax=Nostocoides sp. TaxID=1917966 RepID=UPI003BAF4DEB